MIYIWKRLQWKPVPKAEKRIVRVSKVLEGESLEPEQEASDSNVVYTLPQVFTQAHTLLR